MSNDRLVICVAVFFCIFFISPLNADSQKNADNILSSLFSSISKLLAYFKENYQDATFGMVFGLRIIEGQCKLLIGEFERHQLTVSLAGSDNVNLTIIQLKKIAKDAGAYANMAVPHLQEHDRDYFNRMSKLIIEPWKVFHSHRIVDYSVTLKNEEKFIRKFTENDNDRCISELLGGSKPTGRKCLITKDCIQLMLGLGQSGYQLQRQLYYTIVAQVVGCEAYLNEYLVALTRFKNLEQLQHHFCSNAYYELFDQNSLTMKDADLFVETQFFCPSIGYFQFARREWLESIMSWQSKKGCFPDFLSTEGQHDDVHKNVQDKNTNKPLELDVHGSGLVKGYLEPPSNFGSEYHSYQNTKDVIAIKDENSVQNYGVVGSLENAKNVNNLHLAQHEYFHTPELENNPGKMYDNKHLSIQVPHFLGVQRKLQSVSLPRVDDWQMFDKNMNGCRSHLTWAASAALAMYLRYLIDAGPTEFFQMRMEALKLQSQFNKNQKSQLSKDRFKPGLKSNSENVFAHHNSLSSTNSAKNSPSFLKMDAQAKNYMGIYQRWKPNYSISHTGFMQNDGSNNARIIDYVNRPSLQKDLRDWTIAYNASAVTEGKNNELKKKLSKKGKRNGTLISNAPFQNQHKYSNIIYDKENLTKQADKLMTIKMRVFAIPNDLLRKDLDIYLIGITITSLICLVCLFRYFCYRKLICKRGKRTVI